MGYMGMEMQKWIYTMRPRKPFSIQRKGSFTPVPNHNREFKLQPSKRSNSFIISIVILLFFGLIIPIVLSRWMVYEKNHYNHQIEAKKAKDLWAFNFLMKSGKHRLENQNYKGAYSEFKLAQAIYPENIDVEELLKETVIFTCYNHGLNCKELNRIGSDN